MIVKRKFIGSLLEVQIMIALRLFNNYLLMPPFLFPANDLAGFSPPLPPIASVKYNCTYAMTTTSTTHARHGCAKRRRGRWKCHLPPLLSNSAKPSSYTAPRLTDYPSSVATTGILLQRRNSGTDHQQPHNYLFVFLINV